MNVYACVQNKRIHGLERCEGEVYHDPEFIKDCDCNGVCKNANSNDKSKRILS
jgi:hypothetical protein